MQELKDIDLSRSSKQSLQSQLYQAIRSRIISGRYLAGLKLPASRRLAQELKISRNTVLLTIEHLEAEGYVETRVGAGTYVTQIIPDHFNQVQVKQKVRSGQEHLPDDGSFTGEASFIGEASFRGEASVAKDKTDDYPRPNHYFAPGVPDLKAFPQAIWKKLLKLHSDRTVLMGYDSIQGYGPLRKAIADYLRTSRACECHEGQIIITDGAQQALSLAAQVLLHKGESVYVENPGYIRARNAFLASGCTVMGIEVDKQGILSSKLPLAPKGKVLCLTPTHQYPLGGVLPLQRRMEVLSWLKKNQIWLLEDDYDSEFHFYQKPIAAMQSLGLANQVIYMGSFSKVIFPALRLGYLLVPEKLVPAFVTAKHNMSGESNLMLQAVTADFIQEGHFNRHLLRMRKRYEMKLNTLLEECAKISGLTAMTPGTGMHIVLLLEQGILGDDSIIVEEILQQGINVNALSSYYLEDSNKAFVRQGLVVGFANASQEEIRRGIKIIGRVVNTRF